MKKIYIALERQKGKLDKILIPIKFPFKSKKDMMDKIKPHWKEPSRMVDIIDKHLQSGITYDVLLTMELDYYVDFSVPKRLGINKIRYLFGVKPFRIKLEEERLYKLNKYESYYLPDWFDFFSVPQLIISKEEYVEFIETGYRGGREFPNDLSIFLGSIYYILCSP